MIALGQSGGNYLTHLLVVTGRSQLKYITKFQAGTSQKCARLIWTNVIVGYVSCCYQCTTLLVGLLPSIYNHVVDYM